MIVKKIPILQELWNYEIVDKISEIVLCLTDFRPVFYDIETTGLSRSSTFVYLIGAAVYEDGQWDLYQWMAENSGEEPLILREFSEIMKKGTCTVQYNGNRFDQPYLEERYRKYGSPSPFGETVSLDLYQELRRCRQLLKLQRMKQPDLENFLGREPRIYCDGGKCIRLYKEYMSSGDTALAETVLGHNQEDILGLGAVFSMLSYLVFYKGNYQPREIIVCGGRLCFRLTLPLSLPVPVVTENEQFYLSACGNEAEIKLPLEQGRVRQYYKNYKDYDYLPGEDTAIPKILSTYMDRSLRVPAAPETCYTWILCDDLFLSDKNRQLAFLRHTMPVLLELQ